MDISTVEKYNEMLQKEILNTEDLITLIRMALQSMGKYDTETMKEFVKAGHKLIEVKIYFKRLVNEIKE